MTTLVDENLLLRYLLDDDQTESNRAHAVISQGDATAHSEVLADVVSTLRDVYRVPRPVISAAMGALLDDVLVDDEEAMRLAVRLFGTSELDFPDCLAVAHNAVAGDTIASFDKPLASRLSSRGQHQRIYRDGQPKA